MNADRKETLIGALVAGIGIVFLVTAYGSGADHDYGGVENGYDVTAVFNRTDGLSVGSDVRLAGMSVGKVSHAVLSQDYRSQLTLHVRGDVRLPSDTAALIHSDGLLGAKYVELEPGGAEETLKPSSQIRFTQDSIVVEDLLTKIVAEARSKRGRTAPAAEVPDPGATAEPKL
ncbi:MAG: MlaD family protein [Alphaproteobacteria bacterium]